MAQQEEVLPKGWVTSKLPDAVELILGQSPSSADCNSDGIGLPFYQGKTEFGKLYPTVRKYCTVPKKLAVKNDVLLSVRAPVGPTNLATEKCAIGRGLAVLRGSDNVDFKYLLSYIRHIEPWLSEQGTGTTFKAVSGVFLKDLDFHVAPLPEQKRIVDKLDSLLAQVETIQQRLNNLPNIIKRFRQSVLAAAVSGKLTEQWRLDNEVILAPYVEELKNKRKTHHEDSIRRVGRNTKYKEPQNHSAGIEYEIPMNWRFVSLDSVSWRITYGLTIRPKYVENGVPIISAKEIKSGEVNFKVAKRFESNEYENQREKSKIFKNDVLFSKTGSIGHTAIMKADSPCCSSQNIAVISPLVIPEYLLLVMKSIYIQELASNSVKANAIPDLQLGLMAKFPFPLTSPEEQTEIVRLVEQYFALADTLEKNLSNAKQRVDNLTQSILAKAFKGELVPQDPNDEPADKLLERIKAARLEADALEKAAKKVAKAKTTKSKPVKTSSAKKKASE